MFCKTCGKEINDNAVVCIHCGCAIEGKKALFCKICGKEINDNAVVCIHCGCAIEDKKALSQEKDLIMVAYILLGLIFCAHRLYAGQKRGVLYLVLCLIAYATAFVGVGFVIGVVLLVFAVIDISKAVNEHKIVDASGNEKTI